jgi:hypothetical protein
MKDELKSKIMITNQSGWLTPALNFGLDRNLNPSLP